MSMIKSIMLASAGLSLLLPAAPAQVLNAKILSSQVSLRRVCVMPVEAGWVKVTLTARQPMTEEADAWSVRMQPVISKALANVGAEEVSVATGTGVPEKDEAIRQSVFRLERKYDEMAILLHKHPGGTKQGRFTLGDEVALVPCAAQADAILFVRSVERYSPYPLSGDYPELYLTMLDPRSGEVLAHARIVTVGNDFRKDPEDTYLDLLVDRFHRMQVGTPKPKKK
jgi:hypothetical protein